MVKRHLPGAQNKHWISSNDEICADNYNYFRFKLKGNGRSEFWEVYLYGDQTIKVDRDSEEVLPGGVPPLGIDGVNFGSSPNLAFPELWRNSRRWTHRVD